jgi:hypothetical protein
VTAGADRGARYAHWSISLRAGVAVVILGVSILPVGEWLDQRFQRALSYQGVGLGLGTALVALLGAVLFIVFRHDDRASLLSRPLDALVSAFERQPWRACALLGGIAALLYVYVAWTVFDATPLLIDEIVQVWQARVFAGGDLWLPLGAHPEFQSIMHLVEQDGRLYGQFPPGGPAMLALGELIRAPWLVNPVSGGISAALFAAVLHWSGIRPRVVLGAALLFAFAPFVVFQSASHMNHVTALMWLLVAAAALVRATRDGVDRPLAGFICGLGLGVAATIRPLDAAAFAVPAAVWLAARAINKRCWRAFLLSGAGVAIPMAAMLWVNAHTTGHPLTFGYTVLWGESHGLGFHESPWGERHDWARGVALTAAYLNRLNEFLFEIPIPSLIPALAAFALTRRFAPIERYLLVSSGLILGAYFAYWHDGFYLGPRFLVPLSPALALLVARLPGVIAERSQSRRVARAVIAAYAATAILGVWLMLPYRVRSYQSGFQSMRWDYDRLAATAGARNGVVLVRESWGAQVIARLWALGVSRSFAEILYRKVDTCGLDYAAAALARGAARGVEAENRLRPLLADSVRVVASPFSPDATERVLPGSVYPPDCIQRIEEDRAGYAHFAPVLLARDTTIRWLRDLHAHDTLVVTLGERPIWLLRRTPDTVSVELELRRLSADSLRAAWYGSSDSRSLTRDAARSFR